jgi:hypothetical protein
MTKKMRLARLLVAGAAVVALASSAVLARPVQAANVVPPPSPPAPAVPAGNVAYLVGHAVGTQTYSCTSAGTWGTTSVPQATLYGDNGHQIATHYAGPTWQAKDGSTVVGTKIASVTSPLGSAAAIAWLLLQAVSTTTGPDGGDRLSGTTYVQRVNTVGGVGPTGSCTYSSDPTANQTVSVPYTADYYFYEAAEAE